MTDILVMGSNTVDLYVETAADLIDIDHHNRDDESLLGFQVGDKVLAENVSFDVGGSGLNAATAFARTGLETTYLGCLGDDMFGARILNHFDDENITFRGSLGDQSGIGIILESDAADRTILSYKGCNNDLTEADVPDNLSPDWFYSSTVLGDTKRTMESLIQSFDETTTAINVSSYLADHGINELESILSHTDYLFLNQDEARRLTGNDDLINMFSELNTVLRGSAIITHGDRGVYYEDDTTYYHVPPRPTNVVETTGAGDAFNAGFVTAKANGRPQHRAVKAGMIQAEHVLEHASTTDDLLSKQALLDELNDAEYTTEVIQ